MTTSALGLTWAAQAAGGALSPDYDTSLPNSGEKTGDRLPSPPASTHPTHSAQLSGFSPTSFVGNSVSVGGSCTFVHLSDDYWHGTSFGTLSSLVWRWLAWIPNPFRLVQPLQQCQLAWRKKACKTLGGGKRQRLNARHGFVISLGFYISFKLVFASPDRWLQEQKLICRHSIIFWAHKGTTKGTTNSFRGTLKFPEGWW